MNPSFSREKRAPGTIIAHRGASGTAPENTLAAFRLAWKLGSDGVECDLRLTRDGRVILLHDEDALRTTGAKVVPSSVSLAEIQQLDAGSFKGPKWKGERIPTLREVLAEVPKGKSIFLELKDGAALLEPLERDLADGIDPGQVIMIAFDPGLIVEARRRFPKSSAFWLHEGCKDAKESEWPALRRELIAHAVQGGLEGLDLCGTRRPHEAQAQFIDAGFVRDIHDAGLQLATWTINDVSLGKHLLSIGVDSIATDLPELFLTGTPQAHSALPAGK